MLSLFFVLLTGPLFTKLRRLRRLFFMGIVGYFFAYYFTGVAGLNPFFVCFLFFPAIGASVYFTVKRYVENVFFLLERGKKAVGIISKCCNRRLSGAEPDILDPVYGLSLYQSGSDVNDFRCQHWKFLDEDGNLWETGAAYPSVEKHAVREGDAGYVYYDPANPRNSIWLGSQWQRYIFPLCGLTPMEGE